LMACIIRKVCLLSERPYRYRYLTCGNETTIRIGGKNRPPLAKGAVLFDPRYKKLWILPHLRWNTGREH